MKRLVQVKMKTKAATGFILIIPAKADVERDAVASSWQEAGGEVLRLDRFWAPPEVDRQRVRLYGNDTFCLVVAQKLGLELASPPDDLLVRVEAKWLKRQLLLSSFDAIAGEGFPRFVKPLVPKAFRARVYANHSELRAECAGLGGETPVLASEVVQIDAEARAFILDGQVCTCAIYEGQGSTDDALAFLAEVARAARLPSTCVLDAALVQGRGWALLEANATWGAGLNGCDPTAVVPCLMRATRPESPAKRG